MGDYALPIEPGSPNPRRHSRLTEAASRLGITLPVSAIAKTVAAVAAAEQSQAAVAAVRRAAKLDEHRRPDCICRLPEASARFGATHATACPRYGEVHDVDVARADHLAGLGWHVAWTSSCSCGAVSAGGYRTAGEARRVLEDTVP